MPVNLIMINNGSTFYTGCPTDGCLKSLHIKKRTESKRGVQSTGSILFRCQKTMIVFEIDCRNPETFSRNNPPVVCRCSTCNSTRIPEKHYINGSSGCYVRFCRCCFTFSRDEHERIQVRRVVYTKKNVRFAPTEIRIQERYYEIPKGNNLRPVRRR